MTTTALCLHVLLAAILVGPQVLLFFAVIPSTWLIDDEGLRRRVTAVVTRRYALLSGITLVGLIATGLYQFYSDLVGPGIREDMMAYRFGPVFTAKMTALILLIVLTAVHGIVFGRRIRAASEAVERGEVSPDVLEGARRNSLLFSMLILVVSMLILVLGVMLADHTFSHVAI